MINKEKVFFSEYTNLDFHLLLEDGICAIPRDKQTHIFIYFDRPEEDLHEIRSEYAFKKFTI